MSEKLYAVLFRLFPARFRTAWRGEALELLRDRLHNERGPRARLRLWFDLLADLAASVPRAYLRDQPPLVPAASAQSEGVPSFHLVENQPIPSRAYFFASVLSIVLIMSVAVMLKRGGHLYILRPGAAAEAGGVTLDPWATGRGSGTGIGPAGSGPADAESGSGSAQAAPATRAQAAPGSSATLRAPGKSPMPLFDEAERHRVLLGIVDNLRKYDPDPAAARKVTWTLRANETFGRYRSIGDPAQFASVVTRQIRDASGDLHLELAYIQRPMRADPEFSQVEEARYRAVLLDSHCGFTDVRILPGNIGYLKLDMFPPVDVCGETAIASMKSLSRADSLIIDLRDNSGGQPEMVMFLAGWLFDKPVFFYNPREDDAARMWTRSPMAGSGLAGKPVYVLTSSRTWSAAEHFSYDLKMLHRATIVGETTGGATDIGAFHRIDEHFGIAILQNRVRNPYPAPDWAVNGVQPDIRVPSADALSTAEKLAAQQLARR